MGSERTAAGVATRASNDLPDSVSEDSVVFIVERLEQNFAVLRGPEGEEYYSSIVRRWSLEPGSRIRVPRDGDGALDWKRMSPLEAE